MSTEFSESPLFRTRSRRHHYIPQFLVEGFVNERGKLYVYDKAKDCILKNEKAPKSIFYEFERNTIPLKDGVTSSIIEDFFIINLIAMRPALSRSFVMRN